MTVWRHLRLGLVVLMLGATTWLGLREGIDNARVASTPGQTAATVSQILYGAIAAVALAALFARPAWARPALFVWSAAIAVTATLAPVVWGGSDWPAGALAGGATVGIAALVTWGGLAHLRSRTTAGAGPASPDPGLPG